MLEPDCFSAEYRSGDLFLLCSDGLSGTVSPLKLAETLRGDSLPAEKLLRLKDLVWKRGAEDNVTILLFEVRER